MQHSLPKNCYRIAIRHHFQGVHIHEEFSRRIVNIVSGVEEGNTSNVALSLSRSNHKLLVLWIFNILHLNFLVYQYINI